MRKLFVVILWIRVNSAIACSSRPNEPWAFPMCAQQKLSRINARILACRHLSPVGWALAGAVGAAKKRNLVYNANMEKWKYDADDGARRGEARLATGWCILCSRGITRDIGGFARICLPAKLRFDARLPQKMLVVGHQCTAMEMVSKNISWGIF
jgi:hypothetical protein